MQEINKDKSYRQISYQDIPFFSFMRVQSNIINQFNIKKFSTT